MNKLSALWKGASYQDHLLQSYRQFHLLVQSALLAIGAGLVVASFIFDGGDKQALYLLLMLVSSVGIYLLMSMSRLLKARAQDVDYYHNLIIEAEKSLPKEEQVLTAFKVYQKYGRKETASAQFYSSFEMTEAIRNQLTEKGKGHTRKVLDRNLFIGFGLLWISFHVVMIAKLL